MRSQFGAVLCRSQVVDILVGPIPAATRAPQEAGRTNARVRGVSCVTDNIMKR